MGVYRRGEIWWIDYYDQNRERVQESSQSPCKRDAEAILALRKSELIRGVLKRPVKIAFREFGERYMEHAKANKRSWLRDEQMYRNLKEFFGSERQHEITDILRDLEFRARQHNALRGVCVDEIEQRMDIGHRGLRSVRGPHASAALSRSRTLRIDVYSRRANARSDRCVFEQAR